MRCSALDILWAAMMSSFEMLMEPWSLHYAQAAHHPHGRVALLPYVPYTRKALISKAFNGAPQTIGQHILKKRLEDGLLQRELAERLGVDPYTVMNWEKGRIATIPATRMPGVVAYLGWNPEPKADTIGGQLRWKRRSLGWTTAEAARRNSVDVSTWQGWEQLADWPRYPRFKRFLQGFLAMPIEKLQLEIRQPDKPAPRRTTPV
jgi:transcriptional regulator with XRE-family HTH domain